MKKAYDKKWLIFVFSVLALFLVAPLFVPTPKASAALTADAITKARFLDADQIKVDFDNGFSSLFKDTDPMDGQLRYEASGNPHGCGGWIDFNILASQKYDNILHYIDGGKDTATADMNVPTQAGPNAPFKCEEIVSSGFNIGLKIDDFQKGRNVFRYADTDTIERVDGNSDWVFKRSAVQGQAHIYFRTKDSGASECKDFIQLVGNGTSYLLFDIDKAGNLGSVPSKYPFGKGCKYNDKTGEAFHIYDYLWNRQKEKLDTELPLGNPEKKPADINKRDSQDASQAGGAASNEPTCETQVGFLGFIMCPVITMLDAGMGLIDALIQNMLNVNMDPFVEPNSNLRVAWSTIRNVAYIITIPIMLIMVIGTALGFELVSAYTVKKALPRLVVAVIFISLSYEICVFLISVSNGVGQGTLGLLTYPFGDSLNDLFKPHGGSLVQSGILGQTVLGVVSIGSAVVTAVAVAGLVIFFAAPILLFAAVGFLALLFRQMMIVLLVLLAPLAILAWVFPGNDKLWKAWWGLFSKLLIMYPLIMALIAAGRVFAFILGD